MKLSEMVKEMPIFSYVRGLAWCGWYIYLVGWPWPAIEHPPATLSLPPAV